MNSFDLIIIGAGAAGLMCAAQAGYRGKRVLVLDHAPKAASKIRISGGGKCNFTNLDVAPENYICSNPHFVKSALARYPSSDFIELVERHGIEYEERTHGRLFTLAGAGQIIQMLRQECDWAQAEIRLNTNINSVEALPAGGFSLQTASGELQAEKLVIATGGLAYPKLKATDFGMQIAKQFGLKVIASQPGLVPLEFKANSWFAELAGLSLEVVAECAGKSFRDALLFTHHGLSGPAILQVSNYWQAGKPITINLLPDTNVLAQLLSFKRQGRTINQWLNQQGWSKRFNQIWLQKYPLACELAECPDDALADWAKNLSEWTLYPEQTAGYGKAEVSLGGVDTDEVSSKTMEAHKQPGLFFIGEVLDVTGQLGGYNFQWAWASAHAAAAAV